MYQFCKTFKVTPKEYYEQSIDDIDMMLMIDYEAKKFEIDEMERKSKQNTRKF